MKRPEGWITAVHFMVKPDEGYVVDQVIVTPEVEGATAYKNLKYPKESKVPRLYYVTKIAGNINIKITTRKLPEGEGYKVTFAKDDHVTVDVFYTQDYEKEPNAKDATAAFSRAASDGAIDVSGSGQVNFRVNVAPGYLLKGVAPSAADSNYYNDCKTIDEEKNIYRLTKIENDVTINIAAKECAHEYELTSKTPAECEKAGKEVYTCKVCGLTDEKVISKTGHKDTKLINVKAATNTAEGYTGDTYCNTCRQIIAKGVSIAKLVNAGTAAPKKGDTVKDAKGNSYKITKAGAKNGEVSFQAPKNKKVTSVDIPATIKVSGITYKVTAVAANAMKGCTKLTSVTVGANVRTIGKKAFFGCAKLKTVTIKTTALKKGKIGSGAFGKIAAKAVVKVPATKLNSYKKLLKSAGLSGKKQSVKKG